MFRPADPSVRRERSRDRPLPYRGGPRRPLWIPVVLVASVLAALSRSSALANDRRRRAYLLIRERPGLHLRQLSRELGMGLGVLRMHLNILLRAGLLTSRPTGRRRIYYADGYRGPEGASRRERLLERIRASPGLSTTELATRARCSRMLAHYHVKGLLAEGRIERKRSGRRFLLYPRTGAARASIAASSGNKRGASEAAPRTHEISSAASRRRRAAGRRDL